MGCPNGYKNQEQLAQLLMHCILPRKGKLDGEQRKYESTGSFKELRRAHAAVESGINALENHGLDRVLDYGLDGFERYVALAIVARNIHLLGSKLQEMELAALEHTRRRAAWAVAAADRRNGKQFGLSLSFVNILKLVPIEMVTLVF
jgi:hypothetical protein